MAYILQLLHRRLVGLPSTQQIGAVAVAVLGVGGRARRTLPIGVRALGIVLLGNVVGKIRRNHFPYLLRLALVDIFRRGVAVGMSGALRQPLVVVAVHQGSVVVGG